MEITELIFIVAICPVLSQGSGPVCILLHTIKEPYLPYEVQQSMLTYSFLYVQKTFLVTAMKTPPDFSVLFNLLESFPAFTIYENNKYMIYQLLSHQKIMCHSRRDRRHLRFGSQELVINDNLLPGRKLQPLHISGNFGEMFLHIVIKQAASL